MFYIRKHHINWNNETWSILIFHFIFRLLCPHFEVTAPPAVYKGPDEDIAMNSYLQLLFFVAFMESLCNFLLDLWEHYLEPWVTGRQGGPPRWWEWWDEAFIEEVFALEVGPLYVICLFAGMKPFMLVELVTTIKFKDLCGLDNPQWKSEPICPAYLQLTMFFAFGVFRVGSMVWLGRFIRLGEEFVGWLQA